MTFEIQENTLTIVLPQRIDTSNVNLVEGEIAKIIESQPHEKLVFDATDLDYISSVGLRLILKCKKEDDTLCLINVSSDVYEVFEMTGFTQILHVQKRFREISIEGCALIGKGAYGKVYRLTPDTIVKSFYRGNPLSSIERERDLAKFAFVKGIPTAISYDVVKIKEEKLGTVYELIASDSLLDAFLKNPDRYQEYLGQYVRLLDQIGKTKVDSDLIPSYKIDLYDRLDWCKGHVDDAFLARCRAFVDSLPEGDYLLHGDCHFKNIFVTQDGLMLIDMDTLSKGDPIYELGCLCKTYITFDTLEPGNTTEFFGVDGTFCAQLFNDLFDGLRKDDPEIDKTKLKVMAIGWFMYLGHCCLKAEKKAKQIQEATPILESYLKALGF